MHGTLYIAYVAPSLSNDNGYEEVNGLDRQAKGHGEGRAGISELRLMHFCITRTSAGYNFLFDLFCFQMQFWKRSSLKDSSKKERKKSKLSEE